MLRALAAWIEASETRASSASSLRCRGTSARACALALARDALELERRQGAGKMRPELKPLKRLALCWSVFCLALMLTPAASAVTNKELLRVEHNQAFQGLCCFSWSESVAVSEPSTVAPVIVTWSTDYQATGSFLVALSVNGGPCRFLGPAWINPFGRGDGGGFFESHYIQWLISPSDGLHKGINTFTLCGGAASSPPAVIVLGFNTLSVRTSK